MFRSITNLTALASEFNLESFGDKAMFALENSLLGILIVFAVLAVLFTVVKIVAGFMGEKSGKKSAEKPAAPAPVAVPAPAPTPVAVSAPVSSPSPATADDGEIVAAITAAISLMLEAEGKDPRGFRVVSFRRSSTRKNSL